MCDRYWRVRSERGLGGGRVLSGSGEGRRGLRGGGAAAALWPVRAPAAAGRGGPVPREGSAWLQPAQSSRLPLRAPQLGRRGLVRVASNPFLHLGVPQVPRHGPEERGLPPGSGGAGRPAPPGPAPPPAAESTGRWPGGGGSAGRSPLPAPIGRAVPEEPNPVFQSSVSILSSWKDTWYIFLFPSAPFTLFNSTTCRCHGCSVFRTARTAGPYHSVSPKHGAARSTSLQPRKPMPIYSHSWKISRSFQMHPSRLLSGRRVNYHLLPGDGSHGQARARRPGRGDRSRVRPSPPAAAGSRAGHNRPSCTLAAWPSDPRCGSDWVRGALQ